MRPLLQRLSRTRKVSEKSALVLSRGFSSHKPIDDDEALESLYVRKTKYQLDNRPKMTSEEWLRSPRNVVDRMVKAAKMGANDPDLWSHFTRKLKFAADHLEPTDIVRAWYAFGEIKYRHPSVYKILSPLTLSILNDLSPHALSILMNAYKRLESPRTSQIDFLITECCAKMDQMTASQLSLCLNSASFYYVEHSLFWKIALKHLQSLTTTLNELDLTLCVSSLARMGIRNTSLLSLLARRSISLSHKLSPTQLSVLMNSFAKLDFNDHRLRTTLQKRCHQILDYEISDSPTPPLLSSNKANSPNQGSEAPAGTLTSAHATAIPSTDSVPSVAVSGEKESVVLPAMRLPRKGNVRDGEKAAVELAKKIKLDPTLFFDHFGLINVAFACFCFTGCSETLARKLLYVMRERKEHLMKSKGGIQKLKLIELSIRLEYHSLYVSLSNEDKNFLYGIRSYDDKMLKSHNKDSKWCNEIIWILQEMKISFEKKIYSNPHSLDIYFPEQSVVIKCLGLYSYYRDSKERTAASKLYQRHLESQGIHVATLSYDVWNELTSVDMKKKYLYSFGREIHQKMLQEKIKLSSNENDDIQDPYHYYSEECRPAIIKRIQPKTLLPS